MFVAALTLDGRVAAKNDELEFLNEPSKGKIESMIVYVLDVIGRMKQKIIGSGRNKYKRVKFVSNILQ